MITIIIQLHSLLIIHLFLRHFSHKKRLYKGVCNRFDTTTIPSNISRGNSISPQEIHNMNMEVQKMLNKHAIQMVPPQQTNKGFHSQLFVVPKKDGGLRPIINLKRLNSFAAPVHLKIRGKYMLKDLLREGDWMTKVQI